MSRNQSVARRVDDQRILSGILHVIKVGYRWKVCLTEYCPSTTVYNRFNHWSRRRIWTTIRQTLVNKGCWCTPRQLIPEMLEPIVPPMMEREAKNQMIGPSRGGQTTKPHTLIDLLGRPAMLILTPGNISDVAVAEDLINAAGYVQHLIADKGYDADALHTKLRAAGTSLIIPGRHNRKKMTHYDKNATKTGG